MNTCRFRSSVGVFAAVLALQATNLHAEVSAVGGVDVNTAYIYHGYAYNDGPVSQPWVDLTKGPITFGFWANFDMHTVPGVVEAGEFSEIDLTVSYDVKYLGIDWTLRYAEYLYPHVSNVEGTGAYPGSRELILRAKRKLIAGLGTELRLQYDIDEYNDLYARLAMTYDHGFTEKISMALWSSVAYAGEDVSFGGVSGMNEYDLRVTGYYAASKASTLGANVGYTDTLDEDVFPEQDEKWYGGVSLIHVF